MPCLGDSSEKTRSNTYQTPRRANRDTPGSPQAIDDAYVAYRQPHAADDAHVYSKIYTGNSARQRHRAVALVGFLGHALAGLRQPVDELLDLI